MLDIVIRAAIRDEATARLGRQSLENLVRVPAKHFGMVATKDATEANSLRKGNLSATVKKELAYQGGQLGSFLDRLVVSSYTSKDNESLISVRPPATFCDSITKFNSTSHRG